MQDIWSRRHVLSGFAVGALAASSRKVWAQAAGPGSGMLARLRAAKKVTVGLANQPPFSAIAPDGTLTGCAPTIVKLIMDRLGVPEVVGVAATYRELIPGLRAGRWDFITAALTITKLRCKQILYSDPVLFDGGAFVTLKGTFADPPTLVAGLVARKLTVGVSTGGAHARFTLDHAAFGWNHPNADNVIDFKNLEHAFREKPVSTFSQHALEAGLPIAQKFGFTTPPDLAFVTSDEICTTGT